MKLERAIEILTMFDENRWPGPAKDFDDALNLLIEAAKRIGFLRELAYHQTLQLLPGETMEADDAQSLEG